MGPGPPTWIRVVGSVVDRLVDVPTETICENLTPSNFITGKQRVVVLELDEVHAAHRSGTAAEARDLDTEILQ